MSISQAGILSTGTEILQGLYADTNAQWLSERLHGMGIPVIRHVAAPDDADSVADALSFLVDRCEVVLMTGGLGPTEDDLTRAAVAKVFGSTLAEDPRAWRMIEQRWFHRGASPPGSNRVQCLVPVGSRTLYNHWGTAPGFLMEREDVWFAAMPGPPREMRPMFQKYLEKELADRFAKEGSSRLLTLHTVGCSESALNDSLRPLFEELKDDPGAALSFLAGMARVDIRLHVRARTPEETRKRLTSLRGKVLRRIPRDAVYGKNEDTLESAVSRLLKKEGLSLAVAESCTGGLIAKRITDLPGSSEVFRQGWVTYSNESKRSCLGVRAASLKRHGAVSAQVAGEMAEGALKRSGAQVAVSTTGIAGPSGGTPEKPVGLVHYGLAWRFGDNDPVSLRTAHTRIPTTREVVRLYASHFALDLVRRLLLGSLAGP